jgi:hypothetical protein
MKAVAVAVVPLVAIAAPRLAHAEPDVAIGVAVGPNLPSGNVGLVVQYGPAPWAAIEAGAGKDVVNFQRDGVQTALTLRLRGELGGPFHVLLGAGGSMGRIDRMTTDDVCFIDGHGCADIANGFAWWTHADFGVEARFEHVFARIDAGARWIGNRTAVCREPEPTWEPCVSNGFVGIAFGARL